MAVMASSEGEPGDRSLPDPAARPCVISGVLFDRREQPASPALVASQCVDRVAEHLEHMARWAHSGWTVGDANQYVVSTRLADGADLVSSFCSEPLEDIHWWVSVSGAAAEANERPRREHLERFGFAKSPDGSRWERDVRITSSRDAGAAAQDLLALVSEGFGYSGLAPLGYALTQSRRAEAGLVYRALSPDDLRKLLHGWGYRAELATTAGGNPVIRSASGGFKFNILFAWPAKDGRLFGCLNYVTVFSCRSGLTLEVVNDISRSSRFSRLYLDDEADLILERDVSLTGGVSGDYLQECLLDWACMMESVLKKIDKLVAPPMVIH